MEQRFCCLDPVILKIKINLMSPQTSEIRDSLYRKNVRHKELESVISESQLGALLCVNCTVRYMQSALSPSRIHKRHFLHLITDSHISPLPIQSRVGARVIISILLLRNHSLKPTTLYSPCTSKQNTTNQLSDSKISVTLSSHYHVESNCDIHRSQY